MLKRGLSPLIAVVLIIGFTVAIAAVIMTWGTGFIRGVQKTTEEAAEKELTLAVEALLDIRDVTLLGNEIKLTVENTGSQEIKNIRVRVYGSDDVDTISTTGLESYGVDKFDIVFDSDKVGAVERVEAMPIIEYGGESVVCSNCADVEKKIKLSEDGLVLYLPLDGNTNDHSGLNNHGENYGATYTSEGKIGGAYSFGGNDWIDCGNDASLDIVDGITIEVWANANDIVSTNVDTGIVIKGSYTYGITRDERSAGNRRIWAYINGGGNHIVTDINLGTWQHIAFVYDKNLPNQNMKLYVNGILEQSETYTIPISTTTANLMVGRNGAQYFNGKIDEIKIYNRALSYSEVKAHYLKGA